ncbi:dUTP diphosphatase [Apilactobacillus micheneri]|uniref:dUTP diphosphatase n=1 Tax=Apilactobacillus micheneri TaxID=1899430 RepID=UPI001128D5A4|nr:dUTP diphosphatase [Apilactobacillus micheneri]TPR49182.1 dUTP diphosphatase [Apilactobacillus micheneri]
MNKIKFEFIKEFQNDPKLDLPKRSTAKSAGYDFQAAEDVTILQYSKSHKVYLIKSGIKAAMPKNVYLQLSNRSSTGTKKGLMNPNGIGVIDADYYNNDKNEGHIMFPVINMNNESYSLHKGDRIFQGIFLSYNMVDNDDVDPLKKRGGGFGSTDK